MVGRMGQEEGHNRGGKWETVALDMRDLHQMLSLSLLLYMFPYSSWICTKQRVGTGPRRPIGEWEARINIFPVPQTSFHHSIQHSLFWHSYILWWELNCQSPHTNAPISPSQDSSGSQLNRLSFFPEDMFQLLKGQHLVSDATWYVGARASSVNRNSYKIFLNWLEVFVKKNKELLCSLFSNCPLQPSHYSSCPEEIVE